MTWTFDPLQSLNAYFNFNRLGVFANRYLTDFYGTDPESFLHQTGTDRLWVTWSLNSRRVEEHIAKMRATSELDKPYALVEVGGSNEPIVHEMRWDIASTRLCIEIPRDIVLLERENEDLARRWREATRQAFLGAIAAGFLVIDFVRGEGMGRYQLEHSTAHPELAAFGSAKL